MRSLRWLAWIVFALVFLLLAWGNVASSVGSALACPEWPICGGALQQPETWELVLEWGHRILAAAAAAGILALFYLTFQNTPRAEKSIRRSTLVAALSIALQTGLGAWIGLVGLSTTLSVLHALMTHIVLAALFLMALCLHEDPIERKHIHPKIARLSAAALGGVFLQIFLGAWVRHGRAGLSCPSFPLCGPDFFPNSVDLASLLAFLHRWWGIALMGVFVHIVVVARKERNAPIAAAWGVLITALLQVGWGAASVLTELQTAVRAIHSILAHVLWLQVFLFALRMGHLRGLWHG